MDTPLPKSVVAFRNLVRAARREPQREALFDRIQEEGGERAKGAAAKLYESRLIEFTRIPIVSRTYGWDLAVSHFEAWNALAGLRSLTFARQLRAWAVGKDGKLAAEAAKHLAWIAHDVDLNRLLQFVESGSWQMRGAVAYGARLAALHKHASQKFRRRMYDAFVPLVTGGVPVPATNVVEEAVSDVLEALPALNRAEAYRLLMSDRVFHDRNPAIRQVVLRLYFDGNESPPLFRGGVEPAVLWPVYESLRKRRPKLARGLGPDPDAPYQQTMGLILHLASRVDPIATARECKAVLKDKRVKKDSSLRREAAAALKRCRGIPAPGEVLQEFYRRPKMFGRKATEVIRAYEFYEHFLGDGLPLYFGNLGDQWRAAHAGFKAVGAESAAAIVRRGAEIVEKFGPLKTREQVVDTFAEVDGPALRKLEVLDREFDRESKELLAAFERFIAKHPTDFGGRTAGA